MFLRLYVVVYIVETMAYSVTIGEEHYEKLTKIQKNVSKFGEPDFKDLVEDGIDIMFEEVEIEDGE